MKKIIFLLIAVLSGCNPQAGQIKVLQKRVDSLNAKLADTYKPGFGEFMSSIQIHHNKLWFAGQNKNWKLADFEVHEIMESVEAIQKYQTERKESQMLSCKRILQDLSAVSFY